MAHSSLLRLAQAWTPATWGVRTGGFGKRPQARGGPLHLPWGMRQEPWAISHCLIDPKKRAKTRKRNQTRRTSTAEIRNSNKHPKRTQIGMCVFSFPTTRKTTFNSHRSKRRITQQCKMCIPNTSTRNPKTKLLLVDLGFFLCHFYWSSTEQLSVWFTATNVPWFSRLIVENWPDLVFFTILCVRLKRFKHWG